MKKHWLIGLDADRPTVGRPAPQTSASTSHPAPERLDHAAYIASPRWRGNPARLAELEASGFCCRLCDRGPPEVRLEVHHRTYRNLGCEAVGDLTTLCSACHRVTTDMLRERRRLGSREPGRMWRGERRGPLKPR